MSLNSHIAKQFANPKGISGRFVHFVMNKQNRPLYAEAIKLLSLSDSDSVLDIGCGNGYMLNLLARQHGGEFTGIDISENIIRAASFRNRKFIKSKRMRFDCQNVSTLSFADSCFSKAYSINTVYFWDNLDSVMKKIRRVLKPNGIFINILYSNEILNKLAHTQFEYKKFTKEQLIDAGISAGFTADIIPIINGAACC